MKKTEELRFIALFKALSDTDRDNVIRMMGDMSKISEEPQQSRSYILLHDGKQFA